MLLHRRSPNFELVEINSTLSCKELSVSKLIQTDFLKTPNPMSVLLMPRAEAFEIVSEPVDLVPVRTALQSAGIDYESADSSFLPSMSIPLDADGAKKVFELIDAIEELDDVQNVYSNFDVSDEVMASLE